MHFSIIAPVILAAAPLAVSAKGTLGMCLGGNKPDGSCKMQADYEADFDALSNVTKIVRTYNTGGSCDTGAQIMPAAVSKGFKVVLGVWLVARKTSPNQQLSYIKGPIPKNPISPTKPRLRLSWQIQALLVLSMPLPSVRKLYTEHPLTKLA
jgi:glucan 1,3-beta-glucosidase